MDMNFLLFNGMLLFVGIVSLLFNKYFSLWIIYLAKITLSSNKKKLLGEKYALIFLRVLFVILGIILLITFFAIAF